MRTGWADCTFLFQQVDTVSLLDTFLFTEFILNRLIAVVEEEDPSVCLALARVRMMKIKGTTIFSRFFVFLFSLLFSSLLFSFLSFN